MSFPYINDLINELTGIAIPFPMPSYGFMLVVASLVCMWLTLIEIRRVNKEGTIGPTRFKSINNDPGERDYLPERVVNDLAMIALFGAIIGGRLFHILEQTHEFLVNPWDMIFSRQGYTFYGGLVFGLLGTMTYLRRKRIPILVIFDAIAPAMTLAYAIARVGCQLSGDGDWGVAADLALKPGWIPLWLWAQTYDNNIAGVFISPPGVYPTPIYEIAMGVIAFASIWLIRKHKYRHGWLFSVYLLLTGIERLAIEQIRINTVIPIFGMTATQAEIISGVLIILGIHGIIVFSRKKVASINAGHGE
jgi:phosphatidylglycerol:prolipoprotein diacylglycerol transferase